MQKSLKQKTQSNVRVFVRVRPFNSKEDNGQTCISSIASKSISLKQKQAKEQHNFTFDGIFPKQSSQESVYNQVGKQIINSAFQGLNGTIFCYGQTSSGKTFTCIGPNIRSQTDCGLLPRLLKQTLTRIQKSGKNVEVKMKISLVQIYNEKIKDLLDLSKTELKIRSNKKQGIFIQNITQKYILSEEEAFNYLTYGIHNRSVSATNMNIQSSRSHMIFIINLAIHDFYSGQAKSSKIIMVDLAGSQKISKTGAEGKVLEEAKKINTSLTALGKVINALSDEKISHVPYRDSKLTRLLQESLGGNCITNLIINVSPSSDNQNQTLTSFRFGQRAKSIKNDPIVNKSYTVQQLLNLLKKAQQTVKKQSLLINQLTRKKRQGGYNAISIPSMITMNFLPDEESTQQSIHFQFEQNEQNEFETGQGNILKSERRIASSAKKKKSTYIESNGQEKLLKSQTLNRFPPNCSDSFLSVANNTFTQKMERVVKKLERQNNHRQEIEDKVVQKQSRELEQSKQLNALQVGRQSKQKVRCKSKQKGNKNSAQENLEKIRENLFQLKLRYMQQKRENRIKNMIIERKNRIIQKTKASFIR